MAGVEKRKARKQVQAVDIGMTRDVLPYQQILDSLARQAVEVIRASWVAIKTDASLTAGECFIATSDELAESRQCNGLIEIVDRVWIEAIQDDRSISIDGRTQSRSWKGQELLSAPFRLGDGSIGLLIAGFGAEGYRYGSDAEGRLLDLARSIGMVIDLAVVYAREKQKQESMRLICEVSRDVAQLQPLDKLIPRVVRAIKETFQYDAVSLLLKSTAGDELLIKEVAAGKRVEELLGLHIPITDESEGGIVGWVAFYGKPWLAPDVSKEGRYLKYIEETRSEIAVPLKIGKRVIGVLDVESNELNSLHENDQFILEALADQIAIAIENARLYEELHTARDEVEFKARQLQRLLSRTVCIQEEERKRISAEIHDGVTQLVVAALYEIQAGRALLPRNSAKCEAKLAAGQELLNEVSEKVDFGWKQ